jgi:hypothetical protein
MAASQRIPAGWYPDPARRHEYRYWGGSDWTASVRDGTVTAVDAPETAPLPPPELPPARPPPQLAEPSPVMAPAAPAGKRRRRWAVPVIASAAVAGVVIGLVISAPWASPPLLRPAGLTAGPSTTGSVAFRWSRPATGPAPDRYLILRAGKVIGSVRGTVTFYRQGGLAPATAYQYRVAAVRGGKRSALSPALVLSTATPPLSAARLEGPWTVRLTLVRRGGLLGARRWTESWLTSPRCASGPCAVMLSGRIGGYRFTATLDRRGARYTGTARARLFPCGSGASSFPMRDTMSFHLKVTGAHAGNRAWTASSWTGALAMSNPYTSSANFFCPASSQTAALTGHP